MNNEIVISAAKSKGEGDVAIDLAYEWKFNTAKSWIKSIENDAMDNKKKYYRKGTAAKQLSTTLSVANKTGNLAGVIAGLLAIGGVGAIANICLAACGASCGIVSTILNFIQKRYSTFAKIFNYVLYFCCRICRIITRRIIRSSY